MPQRYFRRVIHISAEDSPNVQARKAIVPGVLTYEEYQKRRATWDPVRQCIGLDGRFYKGAEVLLFPPLWLNRAEQIAKQLEERRVQHSDGTWYKPRRKAQAMGLDSAEGGDSTVWSIGDDLGLLKQISIKTRDTTAIVNKTIALLHEYPSVPPENVILDRGGGGKQHADQLRERGYNVRTVGFGEQPGDPSNYKRFHQAHKPNTERREEMEDRYIYKNRRAELYGLARTLLDPALNEQGYGIPAEYEELRRQLAPLPLLHNEEGRMYLPPKDKPNENYKGKTIKQILGRSPDEADSFVLMIFGLLVKPTVITVGAIREAAPDYEHGVKV